MDSCGFCREIFEKKYKSQRFCSLICSNRFNLNNKNTVALPSTYSLQLAELFGILLGDGSVTKYFVRIYLNAIADLEYAPYVKELASKLFPGASVTSNRRLRDGTIEIQVSSKDVCDYLRSVEFNAKKRYIPLWISNNSSFTKATIRGLFDTEGSVGMKYFRGRNGNYLYKQLTVTNKNENILRFLEKSLASLGYKPTKNSTKNIYLSNYLDIEKYLKDIGSSNPKIIKKITNKQINGFAYGGLRRMVRH